MFAQKHEFEMEWDWDSYVLLIYHADFSIQRKKNTYITERHKSEILSI